MQITSQAQPLDISTEWLTCYNTKIKPSLRKPASNAEAISLRSLTSSHHEPNSHASRDHQISIHVLVLLTDQRVFLAPL